MILFIFEGAKYEPALYEGIKSLFFSRSNDQILCSFCSSIYTFYKHLKNDFGEFADVVDVLKTEIGKVNPDNEIFKYKSADFESIYLFFDYDFYHGDLSSKNSRIMELLDYFNEEAENGKLFISYPMIESIQYTKQLPDSQYQSYTVSRCNSSGTEFKRDARKFCGYKGYAYLKDKNNWMLLVQPNAAGPGRCERSSGVPQREVSVIKPIAYKANCRSPIGAAAKTTQKHSPNSLSSDIDYGDRQRGNIPD